MAKKVESALLTETELELMNILWSIKEGTVRDILNQISEGRTMAYTSASTIIRILEQKKIVESRKEGKAHIYTPLLQKADYEAKTLNHVIEKVFDDTPLDLVKRLVSDRSLSDQEKEEIRRIIAEEL